MKRKKTLPADFQEVLERGNVEEIKDILEKCQADAHMPYEKKTALFFADLPEEIIRYLVTERGADINQVSEHGETALAEHACWRPEHVPLFVELGADVNYFEEFGSAPLHCAAGRFRVEGVKALLEQGANPFITSGWMKDTPMEHLLATCRNADISAAAEIAGMLLDQGVSVTADMKKEVTCIGTDFEFYKADFNPDYLDETVRGLQKLYGLFSVEPVSERQVYDGESPIVAKANAWQEQHEELWNLLVPGSGHASTVQGEVIRIIGKLCHEILDNGGMNWDREYRKLVKALGDFLRMGVPASEEVLSLARQIGVDSDQKQLYLLNEECVKWVLANPNPIQLGAVKYRR